MDGGATRHRDCPILANGDPFGGAFGTDRVLTVSTESTAAVNGLLWSMSSEMEGDM